MSKPSPKKSPFKAVASINATHCGFISMSLLEPNKTYMMTDMKATHHATYGDGLLSFLRGKNNSQWRSQFPPKYLQNFSAEDIETLRDQINLKKYPFIIFRGVLADKSFKIDLAPYSEVLVNAHNKSQDVGIIELSPDTSLEDPFTDRDDLTQAKDENAGVSTAEPDAGKSSDDQLLKGNKRPLDQEPNGNEKKANLND